MAKSRNIRDYLVPGTKAHLIGIGGVSMRPLGLVLRSMGLEITGSDMNSSVSTQELTEKGIPVAIGHRAENIAGADCIIRTAAAHNDNPEIAAARARGIPVFERAQAWGIIMQAYQHAVCISGTHGKTTTTSMVTHIFMEAGLDPTVMIGGYLPLLQAGHRVGQGNTIVMESCEYCNSFHNFFPTIAVVCNVEEDHLDFFRDLAEIQASFRKFCQLVPEDGMVLVNGDDPGAMEALQALPRPMLTFGMAESNDIYPVHSGPLSFDVICKESLYCHIDLKVPGQHNVYNALAAAATAWTMQVPPEAVTRGLASFHGAGRRLEYKGSYKGADVYDDYAHHPGEFRATIQAVRTMGYRRIVCAFQPHTYSRTKALFEDFVQALSLVDVLVLAEIYAARESDTYGVHAQDLADRIPGALAFDTLPEVTAHLAAIAQPGDIILTVGAGDIYKVGEHLIEPAL